MLLNYVFTHLNDSSLLTLAHIFQKIPVLNFKFIQNLKLITFIY